MVLDLLITASARCRPMAAYAAVGGDGMTLTIILIILIQIVLVASAYAVIVVFRAQIKAQQKLIQTQAKTIRTMGTEITNIADHVRTTDHKFENLKIWAYRYIPEEENNVN